VPAHDHAGEHQQPVDRRVQQRAEPRVLARQPGRDAVQVVAARDDGEQDHRRAADAVAGGEREREEHGQQREPDEADRVRDRPDVQRLADQRLRRRRP
jgi:hypothetical protein